MQLFSLEEAVRRMTSLSAAQFRLPNRGVLRNGAVADVVVCDAEAIADPASFENPTQAASGIDWVVVNGAIAWTHTRSTGT